MVELFKSTANSNFIELIMCQVFSYLVTYVCIANFDPSQATIAELTHQKSKSSSSTLSQKTLEDRGSVKLSILHGERTSWLLIFLHVGKLCPTINCLHVHAERKWNSEREQHDAIQTERNENVTVFLSPTVCAAFLTIFSAQCVRCLEKLHTKQKKKVHKYNDRVFKIGSRPCFVGMQNGTCEIFRVFIQIFDHALELKLWRSEVFPMFVQGSHAFAMFYTHALREWAWSRVHTNVTTFTRFAQNCNVGSLLALCGSAMHVATLY